MNPYISSLLLSFILLCAPAGLMADEIVINAVGDIMLAGRWAPELKKKGYGFPFGGVLKELATGDINLGNLESPIARSGTEYTAKKFRFRAEPPVAQALRTAGFNLVTLANNHSMDFGRDALKETMEHLTTAGVSWIGAGNNQDEARKMALYSIKGKKVAFLGYSLTQPIEFFAASRRPGTAPGYEKLVVTDVINARKQADYVIVSFHWGKEATGKVEAYQRNTAHRAIDAGADVIIGHHPHVLQGVEKYKTGIIFYSLGNFTFASKSKTSDLSAIIRMRFGDKQRSAEILPLDVLHRRVGFQPQLLSGKGSEAAISKIRELSKAFKTVILEKDGIYSIPF